MGVLELGDDRGERARKRVDLVFVERRAVQQFRSVLGQHPLEAQHQRVALAPLEAGRLGAGLELGQGIVDREPAGHPGGEIVDRLALEQDRLVCELPHPFEVRFAERVRHARGNVSRISHEKRFRSHARPV
jgi:hypothetical protein